MHARVLQDVSGTDAIALPSLIGLFAGIVTGLGMVLFRLSIEGFQELLLGEDNLEGFETLPAAARFFLPLAGGIAVGVLFQMLSPLTRQVGVAHVIERLAFHEGRLRLRNAAVQFVSAVISLGSGHSGGREGPAIHVGAASAGFIADRLRLPHNIRRILIGCGTAAAIAASFDTPLAGVIFAMEVVLMEYTLTGFTPIVLASVSATLVSRMFFPGNPLFGLTGVEIIPQGEVTTLLAAGLSIGVLAAVLVRLLGRIAGHAGNHPPLARFAVAGLLTGLVAIPVPEVMGIGYDTVHATLSGDLVISTLITIALCKLLVTSAGLGLGIPAGVIGPSLVIGATAGAALGAAYARMGWIDADEQLMFTIVGMGAMMSAVLHAPLAALTALLELTGEHQVVFPAMLVIISANLTTRSLLRTDSAFVTLLRARGVQVRDDPLSQTLSRLGVARAMSSEFAAIPGRVRREVLVDILRQAPRWLILDRGQRVIAAAELAALLETTDDETLDLRNAPLRRRATETVGLRSTLAEAHRRMDARGVDALLISELRDGGEIVGVLTREDLEQTYRIR